MSATPPSRRKGPGKRAGGGRDDRDGRRGSGPPTRIASRRDDSARGPGKPRRAADGRATSDNRRDEADLPKSWGGVARKGASKLAPRDESDHRPRPAYRSKDRAAPPGSAAEVWERSRQGDDGPTGGGRGPAETGADQWVLEGISREAGDAVRRGSSGRRRAGPGRPRQAARHRRGKADGEAVSPSRSRPRAARGVRQGRGTGAGPAAGAAAAGRCSGGSARAFRGSSADPPPARQGSSGCGRGAGAAGGVRLSGRSMA